MTVTGGRGCPCLTGWMRPAWRGRVRFLSGWKCRCARRGGSPNRANVMPALSGRECGLRGRTADKKGEHLRFSPSCQSTPFLLGRAARVRVSDAFRLPPICCVRVSGTVATPGVRTVQCIHPVGRAKLAWATTRRAKLAWTTPLGAPNWPGPRLGAPNAASTP